MSKYIATWPSGFTVMWRNLTWVEYRRFHAAFEMSPFVEPMKLALEIYKTVYIDGPDVNSVPAGIPAFICKQQMINNPFGGSFADLSQAIGLARQAVNGDYLLLAKGIIASTLHYKIEEIDQWDPNTFFIRLAQAEVATGRTINPVNPSIQQSQQAQKAKRPLSSTQQKAADRTKERDRGAN